MADLTRSDLIKLLNSPNLNLCGVDLRGVDLTGLNLAKADLRNANLERCSLRGADLRGAKVVGTNFGKCDLSGCLTDGGDLVLDMSYPKRKLASLGAETEGAFVVDAQGAAF